MFKSMIFLLGLTVLSSSHAVDFFDDVVAVGVAPAAQNESTLVSTENVISQPSGIASQPILSEAPVQEVAQNSIQRVVQSENVTPSASLKSDYRLASGDVVTISVYGEPELSFQEKRLDENGQISYPFLGVVNANNLTAIELESLLTKRLKGDFLIDPKVSVNVKTYRLVYISGAVGAAGAFTYTPGMTVRRLATLAGGVTESASLDEISIISATAQGEVVKLGTLDSVVAPGDTISIPEYKKVFLSGAVNSPGSISYRLGMTVRQAISLAGGLTERASESKISIIKDGEDASRNQRATMDAMVSPGDSISVGEGFF
ncbi:hypothetical protein THMIRHAS_06300 [Thiosulfatimonas sediminis]|uniref:Soluble ligand binding domain-containing protein n=1 Tax=Thiosulfatimonas sediminis TaxID=2675054 RepID=A0A6F8PTA0_9GAMM|nr:polysaccharide biosynthesis/export family protein [Thiosulfatimonas sediminis]BBP45257.1 hypothetical protein THMIRHAS_06300 [Thiosulfatimonas sediminis]